MGSAPEASAYAPIEEPGAVLFLHLHRSIRSRLVGLLFIVLTRTWEMCDALYAGLIMFAVHVYCLYIRLKSAM